MGIVLPEKIGTPAIGNAQSERFVATPCMIARQAALLTEVLASEDSLSIEQAMSAIRNARMPRNAGRVVLGSDVVGAFDLQAFQNGAGKAQIRPQSKLAIDDDTKEPREPGVLVFSATRLIAEDVLGVEAKAIGVAVNPDEQPWLAHDLGVSARSKQNQHGLVIVSTVPFAVGSFALKIATPEEALPADELILPKSVY
jgi:hypothetical protein